MRARTNAVWMALGIAIGLVTGLSLTKISYHPENRVSRSETELKNLALYFSGNIISGRDSRNYRLLSGRMKSIFSAKGAVDSLGYEEALRARNGGHLDSVNFLGAVLSSSDSAKVFLKEFGQASEEGSPFVPFASITIYKFVREVGVWKFDGFES